LKWGILALAFLNLSCSEEPNPIAGSNLILVVADALRADHLGSYGYRRPTSPFIDKLAESSVLFESTISAASQTVPSVLSLMSSQYPSRHGNQYFHRTNSFRAPRRKARPKVPDSLPLLAELLQAGEFRTAAVVTNPWLSPRYGFDRGFETYRSLPEEVGRNAIVNGSAVNQAAEKLLDDFGSERFFLYLHYMDVHNPYQPREPYRSAFVKQLVGRKVYRNGPVPKATKRDIRFTEAHYDGGIREFDDRIRELHKILRRRGLNDNTLFVFISDHGDEFREHDGMGHGWTLYEELVRVPLFFSHPALEPLARRIKEPVSGVDLLPTLLELMDIERPKDLEGESLAPWVLGRSPKAEPPRRILLSELAGIKAARRGSKKLIWTRGEGKQSEAFDLSRDPKERRPLGDRAAWEAELASALETLEFGAVAKRKKTTESEDSEAERRLEAQLEQLGYLDDPSAGSESSSSSEM
jgi:hypothetical protein